MICKSYNKRTFMISYCNSYTIFKLLFQQINDIIQYNTTPVWYFIFYIEYLRCWNRGNLYIHCHSHPYIYFTTLRPWPLLPLEAHFEFNGKKRVKIIIKICLAWKTDNILILKKLSPQINKEQKREEGLE